MAERKTFGNKVGTPRGYVDRAARDKVDEAMQPLAEVGKELIFLTPMGRGARAAKALFGAAKATAKATAKTTAKEIAKDTAKAIEYKPSVAMDTVKATEKVAAKGAKMTQGRQKLMDTLNKSRVAGEKARSAPKGGGRRGTMSERLESTRTRPRTEKEANKFGPLVKKEVNLPAKQGTRAVTPYKESARGVTKYTPSGGSVATTTPRTFGGKGSGMGTNLKRGLAAGAVGGAAYGLYQGADKPNAGGKVAGGARPGERTGGYAESRNKAPVPKVKPSGGSSSGAAKSVKAAGDKSSQANKGKPTSATGTPAKKMTAFERQKARMYEKEGYGGRSMTAAQAKARVEKERGQKMEMPRFLKSFSKEAPKKASGMARPQYSSQKARDFAAKMQGRNPSGKAGKGFKFKDLFK